MKKTDNGFIARLEELEELVNGFKEMGVKSKEVVFVTVLEAKQ